MANTKVTTGVIKDDAVGADQLASNSVVTASIVDNAITTAKINNDAILTAKISNSAVTNAKLAANSVDSDQYVDGSIDTAHIADGQITSAKLDTNISVSGTLTVGSHLNMGDNDILKIGAGDDLQIYHDGSNSFIKDTGTGVLDIATNGTEIQITKDSATLMGKFVIDGAVELYYAGAAKIATTSSGIDVTGTISSGDITSSSFLRVFDGGSQAFGFFKEKTILGTGTSNDLCLFAESITDGGEIHFMTGGSGTKRVTVDSSGNLLVNQTSAGTNGKLQVTGDIGLTGSCTIRQSTNSDTGDTLRFLGTQFVAGSLNSMSYSYSGGGQIASLSASANALLLDVGANNSSGHRLKVQNNADGVTGILTYSGNNVNDSSPTIRLTNSLSSGSWESITGDMGRFEFYTEDTSASAPYVTGRITCNNDATSGSRTLPSGALKFWTREYNSSLSLAMTISSDNNVSIVGSLSKGSGSFKIDHPLESKKDTHHLVHSFVEAPQADNIYRGKVDLVDGSATVNIDTVAGMTEGTFVALNTDVQCFTSNESDWDAVKGSVSGNILTISCQNTLSTAIVSWLVIGERHDQHMFDTEWTDDNGKVIVEPLKISEE